VQDITDTVEIKQIDAMGTGGGPEEPKIGMKISDTIPSETKKDYLSENIVTKPNKKSRFAPDQYKSKKFVQETKYYSGDQKANLKIKDSKLLKTGISSNNISDIFNSTGSGAKVNRAQYQKNTF